MTEQDFINIIKNRIGYEAQKAVIRTNFAPQIAEQLCGYIDSHEKAELFQKLYEEFMASQIRQQQIIQSFNQRYR